MKQRNHGNRPSLCRGNSPPWYPDISPPSPWPPRGCSPLSCWDPRRGTSPLPASSSPPFSRGTFPKLRGERVGWGTVLWMSSSFLIFFFLDSFSNFSWISSCLVNLKIYMLLFCFKQYTCEVLKAEIVIFWFWTRNKLRFSLQK